MGDMNHGKSLIGLIPLEVRDGPIDISERKCTTDSGFATVDI
ncbi:MAG: hypothetical protein Q8Q13_02520 [bacterium]|nr:hypothetical protein [bacterium]